MFYFLTIWCYWLISLLVFMHIS